jgi:4,5-DOPA dioxygenase extradiol
MSSIADVPMVELSVQPAKSTAHHYKVGQALAPLTKEGYLVVGSGLAVHNRKFAGAKAEGAAFPQMWAQAFDDWLRITLLEGR